MGLLIIETVTMTPLSMFAEAFRMIGGGACTSMGGAAQAREER
jgi:hypothetical protein